MNRIQKISWLMVISIGTAVILSTVSIVLLHSRFGFPRAWAGLSFLALAGIGGLGPLFFRNNPGPVQTDERDQQILLKAARAGFAMSYLLVGILCMGIWEWYKHKNAETISIEVLPMIWMGAALTAFFIHALAILILYGKGGDA